ncbi:MAG TPA: tetratricopeptide repeat protein [Gemmataceae bacterium]|nr:tetratricopeptide repeat protein [Gemmataceae bacterium]
MRRPQEALAPLHRAIELQSDHATAHLFLGNALLANNQFDEAIAACQESIRLKNDNPRAHYSLGKAFYGKGKLDEAIFALKESIELGKGDPGVYFSLGIALHRKRRWDEAIASYQQAIRLEPDRLEAHLNLGAILCDVRRDFDGAIAEFRMAIQIRPGNSKAQNNLGRALAGKGQWDEAIAAYKEALRLQPKDVLALNGLAWILASCPDPKFRDIAQAVHQAQLAVKLAPLDPRMWRILGVARYRAGDWKAAITGIEKSMELSKGGDSSDWFFLAMAHWQTGNTEKAQELYRQAVQWMEKQAPEDGDLRRFRAEAAKLIGNPAEKEGPERSKPKD